LVDGKAAATAGVKIVTGDTKVVEHGHAMAATSTRRASAWCAKESRWARIVRSGRRCAGVGNHRDHGMAIMSVREGLELKARSAQTARR